MEELHQDCGKFVECYPVSADQSFHDVSHDKIGVSLQNTHPVVFFIPSFQDVSLLPGETSLKTQEVSGKMGDYVISFPYLTLHFRS